MAVATIVYQIRTFFTSNHKKRAEILISIYLSIYLYIYLYIYIYIYTCMYTVPHVPKCMSCHKAIVMITGSAHCFHDCIYIYIYIYIHRRVFRPSQDSSVWLELTSKEQLMSPECSKHQVLSFAKMFVVW